MYIYKYCTSAGWQRTEIRSGLKRFFSPRRLLQSFVSKQQVLDKHFCIRKLGGLSDLPVSILSCIALRCVIEMHSGSNAFIFCTYAGKINMHLLDSLNYCGFVLILVGANLLWWIQVYIRELQYNIKTCKYLF